MLLFGMYLSEFVTIIEPVDIFDLDRSNAEIESIVGTAAQADAIAARIKKVAIERMEEDPVLYLRLSQLIQTEIDAHRAKRLGDIDYLQQMRSCLETVRSGGANNVPTPLRTRPQARAFYNVFQDKLNDETDNSDVLVLLSIGIEDIITKHKIRDWQHNQDIQNQMINEIDDLVHDLKKTHNLFIPWGALNELIAN